MGDIDLKTKEFCGAWQSLEIIYEDYARKIGVSYNSLYILNTIFENENCTQKQICEKTLLPKQTVNNVISAFYKSGYIELCELPENRRIKTIKLTEKGEEYTKPLVMRIDKASHLAMEALTEEEQDTLLKLINKYVSTFKKEMNIE